MSEIVPSSEIEAIVGVPRHRSIHYGRAVSAEQRVYILHSQRCKDSGVDLRDCRFSVALDRGINVRSWSGWEDKPVLLYVSQSESEPGLIPIGDADA